MVEAIILAGTSRKKKRLIQGRNKFFARINNRMIGAAVVAALDEAAVIDSTYIVGNKSELEKTVSGRKLKDIFQEKGNFYQNAIDAFYHTPNSHDPEKQVLYLACDIPFLNPRAIEDFVLTAPPVDFILPYCVRDDFEGLFPGFRWPYLVCREGQVKFGNVALVRPNRIKNRRLIGRFFALRKVSVSNRRGEEILNNVRVMLEALKLRGAAGLEIVARALFLKYVATPLSLRTNAAKRLSIERIGHVYSSLLDGEVKGVLTRYPELCYDIDNEDIELRYAVDNYEAVMERIKSRRSSVEQLRNGL